MNDGSSDDASASPLSPTPTLVDDGDGSVEETTTTKQLATDDNAKTKTTTANVNASAAKGVVIGAGAAKTTTKKWTTTTKSERRNGVVIKNADANSKRVVARVGRTSLSAKHSLAPKTPAKTTTATSKVIRDGDGVPTKRAAMKRPTTTTTTLSSTRPKKAAQSPRTPTPSTTTTTTSPIVVVPNGDAKRQREAATIAAAADVGEMLPPGAYDALILEASQLQACCNRVTLAEITRELRACETHAEAIRATTQKR